MMRTAILALFLLPAVASAQTVTLSSTKGCGIPHTWMNVVSADGKTSFCLSWVNDSGRPCLFIPSRGHNLSLADTLKREAAFGCVIVTHGPIKISQATFDLAQAAWTRLQAGGPYMALGPWNCIGELRQALGMVGVLVGEPGARAIARRLDRRKP